MTPALCFVTTVTSVHVIAFTVQQSTRLSIVKCALLWIVTQGVVIIPCRRFGTTYPSHLPILKDFWRLKIGPIGCPETSVRNYN